MSLLREANQKEPSSAEVKEAQSRVTEIFGAMDGLVFSPSPFLKTRLMTTFQERARKRAQAKRWKLFGGFAAALTAAAIGVTSYFMIHQAVDGGVGQPMVIVLGDEDGKFRNVAAVQVELPVGVSFESEDSPQLSAFPVLTFPWDHDSQDPRLPIVIKSKEAGLKQVKLRYLDQDRREITSKVLKIRFKPGEETRL